MIVNTNQATTQTATIRFRRYLGIFVGLLALAGGLAAIGFVTPVRETFGNFGIRLGATEIGASTNFISFDSSDNESSPRSERTSPHLTANLSLISPFEFSSQRVSPTHLSMSKLSSLPRSVTFQSSRGSNFSAFSPSPDVSVMVS